jgi:hypothetical protein
MENRVEISTGRYGEDRQPPEEKRKREREREIERGGGGERKKWIAELSLYRGKINEEWQWQHLTLLHIWSLEFSSSSNISYISLFYRMF